MQNDWYICNGSSKNIITDSKLFTVIGYTYGGSGANFNLPNLTGVTSAAGGIPIHYIIKR
jgi:microcystin-dependent protein